MSAQKKARVPPVLILQPFSVLREMELFAFCLIGPRVGKHEEPHGVSPVGIFRIRP